jgi:flagellar basal-body rod protein FlgB
MNIFATAERHMSWLAARQATASTNIANADTPKFKAREIVPFGQELQSVAARMTTSNAAHVQAPNLMSSGFSSRLQNNGEATLSGNDVLIEKEMRTAGENSRLYSFDVGILKSFHQMLLSSVKG